MTQGKKFLEDAKILSENANNFITSCHKKLLLNVLLTKGKIFRKRAKLMTIALAPIPRKGGALWVRFRRNEGG